MKFTNIETWALPTTPSPAALFEIACLLNLEDQWIRLSADDQRAIIGFPIFGKQEFKVDKNGVITVFRSVCFGQDGETVDVKIGTVEKAALSKTVISPGCSGAKFYPTN